MSTVVVVCALIFNEQGGYSTSKVDYPSPIC